MSDPTFLLDPCGTSSWVGMTPLMSLPASGGAKRSIIYFVRPPRGAASPPRPPGGVADEFDASPHPQPRGTFLDPDPPTHKVFWVQISSIWSLGPCHARESSPHRT